MRTASRFRRWIGKKVAAARSELTENRPAGFRWRFVWRRTDFGWHLCKGLFCTAVITGILSLAHGVGMLKGFENASLDAFLRIHNRQKSQEIRIVEITETDYAKYFGSKSPLDPGEVQRLIGAIARYRPRVIGVDLDTSSEAWQADSKRLVKSEDCQQDRPIESAPCIVWAEVPEIPTNGEAPPLAALGSEQGNLSNAGIPVFPVESDGLVRRYYDRRLKVERSQDGEEGVSIQPSPCSLHDDPGCTPSFSRAIREAYLQSRERLGPEEEEAVIFNFYGDRYRFPIIQAGDLLSRESAADSEARAYTRRYLFLGKIVLIGGSFKEARDEYLTPLGSMAGVELNALAIQSEMGGGGIHEVQKRLEVAADVIVASFVIVAFFAWPRHPRRVFWICLLASLPVTVAFSLLIFTTSANWLSFMPIVLGVALHEAIELADAAQESQQGLAESEEEISKLGAELKREQLKHAPKITFQWQFITSVRETVLKLGRRPRAKGPWQDFERRDLEELLAEAYERQKTQGYGGTQLAS